MAQTNHIRGELHPIYSLFMGDSDLNNNYTLKSTIPYEATTQLCNVKQSNQSERALMDTRTDTTNIKFHGKLI